MMRCGLLGEKLGHSYSPAIHAQLADYAYGLYEVAPEDLPAFLTGGDFDALNVTIPYKKAVIPYCAELSPIARKLGSVNVLVRRPDGTLYGDNADLDIHMTPADAAVPELELPTDDALRLLLED